MSPAALIKLLRSPDSAVLVSDSEWNDIIVQGRKNQLLGQLAGRLQHCGALDKVPETVKRHLDLELLISKRRVESALWEVSTLRRALNPEIPLILLKGCAYAAAGDHNSTGRMFSDIDILVRRSVLSTMEVDLISVGWKPTQVSEYDAGYYRNWMHEVPPMEHVRRHTVIDLHHAINPPVSRFYVDPEKLLERIAEVLPGVFVLCDTDRVIHCALHLLQEGEPKKLLRDLYDLHCLVVQHQPGQAGMDQLRQRASELKVENLVVSAIAAAVKIYGPIDGLHEVGLLSGCVVQAACHAHGEPGFVGAASEVAVLAHSHWMKMPLRLLVPHLIRKSFLRMTDEKDGNP